VWVLSGDRDAFVELKAHGHCADGEGKGAVASARKITKQEIMEAEVNDMPPRVRLACQYFVRDEDILVSFIGDETLPAKGPGLSMAASIYKGGLEIIHSTSSSTLRYRSKRCRGALRTTGGRHEGAGQRGGGRVVHQAWRLFTPALRGGQAAHGQSRSCLERSGAQPLAGKRDAGTHCAWAGDAHLSRLDALKVALQGERRSYEFYYAVANTNADAAICAVAKEFVKEEAEHVDALKQWIRAKNINRANGDSKAGSRGLN